MACRATHPGHRRFLTVAADRPFALDHGGRLSDVDDRLRDLGRARRRRPPTRVLVCHAWTGDSHVAGPAGRGHPTPGWWEGVVGPGLPIDTERYFVVCANVLGGCQGSTGPASLDPADGPAVRLDVPGHHRSATWCGCRPGWPTTSASTAGCRCSAARWAGCRCSSGASPTRTGCASLVPIATCAQATAQQIAWGAIGRRSIRLDPRWRGGDYYDAEPGDGPHEGLAIARMVAQVTFRSDNVFTDRFGRELAGGRARRARACGSASRSSATSTTTATSWCAASTPTATW